MLKKSWLESFHSYISRFIDISGNEWDDLCRLMYHKKLAKKEFFNSPDDEFEKIGFIVSGIIRTFFISKDGTEYTTDFCTNNEFAVNYRITAQANEEFYSQALVESELLVINYSSLLELAEKNEKLRVMQSRIVEYYYPLKVSREKSLLALDAEGRYLRFIEEYKNIIDFIPQYQIASYLGITPVALSRVTKKLKLS